jgi:hypothetical protein
MTHSFLFIREAKFLIPFAEFQEKSSRPTPAHNRLAKGMECAGKAQWATALWLKDTQGNTGPLLKSHSGVVAFALPPHSMSVLHSRAAVARPLIPAVFKFDEG